MKMKKFLALILSLALFIGMIPAGYAVSAEDTITPATGTVEATSTEYFTLNRYNFNSDCIGSMKRDDFAWDRCSMLYRRWQAS